MARKYVTESYDERHVDQFGNVSTRTGSKVVEVSVDSEPFFQTYLNYVGWMYDIRGGVALSVMAKLMDEAEYNTGRINMSPAIRRRVRESLGLQDSALTRAINTLIEKHALVRTSYVDKSTGELKYNKGEYQVNPEMFWKGDKKERRKLIVEFKAVYGDSEKKDFVSDSTWD